MALLYLRSPTYNSGHALSDAAFRLGDALDDDIIPSPGPGWISNTNMP